jgi:Ca-activated chloride channel family protein
MWLWGLAGLPAAALLVAAGVRGRRAALAAFVGRGLEPALAPGFSWRRHLAKGVLWMLAFAMLIVAVAGPRFGSQLVKVEREGIDVVIALDTSLSMLAEDVPPNRLDSAKREIMDLIGGLQGDRVGIVAFAGEAVALCPLTVDYDAALMLVRSVDVYTISEPGSAIAGAIDVAVGMFGTEERGDRAVIVVTDGENTEGDPERSARAASEQGIRVFAIGMGTPKGELIPERGTDGSVTGYKKDARGETVLSRLDEAALQRVAAAGNGRYLPATAQGIEIKVLYDEIAGMQKKLIKGEFVERKKERFWVPLALALGCLFLDATVGTRASRRRGDRARPLHTGALLAVVLAGLWLAADALPAAARSVSRGKVRSGNRAYAEGEYGRAFGLYREALGDSTRPRSNAPGVYYNGGNALYQQKRYDRAIDYYQRGFSPDSVLTGRMLYNRGNALLKGGRVNEAVESYIQALQYLPDDEDARHNLEMALAQKQQGAQNQERQRQQQNPSPGDQQEPQDSPSGSESDSTRSEPQPSDEQNRDGGQAPPDSSRAQPQAPDSTEIKPPPADSSSAPLTEEQLRQLSKEDAMRILQALEDREAQLQRERRKAAFRKLKRSGKDW